jgi:hypothetical protein
MNGAHRGMRNVFEILVVKPEGERPLGRPRCRWEDMKMDAKEIGCENVYWINLARDSPLASNDKNSGRITSWDVLDQLLKEDSTPWSKLTSCCYSIISHVTCELVCQENMLFTKQ